MENRKAYGEKKYISVLTPDYLSHHWTIGALLFSFKAPVDSVDNYVKSTLLYCVTVPKKHTLDVRTPLLQSINRSEVISEAYAISLSET